MNILDYVTPKIAYAEVGPAAVTTFVGKINRYIINPLIILLFAAALVYFLYGLVEFLMNANQSEARETGKSHMLWGLVGMVIMFGAYAILRIIASTIGAPSNPNLL